MEGGELFQRIQERNEGAFTERGMYLIVLISKCNIINILHN